MTIIEQLQQFENDEMESWYDLSDKKSNRFLKDIVKLAKEDLPKLRAYCESVLPSEFSSLSIVYEALSEYSAQHNEFLYEEIQRVVNLAKNKQIKPAYLEVLTDIEPEDIYSKDEEVYVKMMNFMTENLHLTNDTKFNVELLDVIDWFLIELDEDDDILQAPQWIERIVNLVENGDAKVKIKARDVLKDVSGAPSYSGPSFLDRLKAIFS